MWNTQTLVRHVTRKFSKGGGSILKMSFFPWLRACLLILLLILVLKFIFFRPLSNIRLPINSTFSTPIQLHNPHFTTLRILEIFSSDCNIQLEFPTEFLIKSNNSIKSVN
ncbi:unnamed protein product [Meloidogyne enterolobii]|uniref:Uncharacterized protein n=1 Tax=Meloidogyne enterolobii TaxID=390850 RepID=A0ACB1AUV7_MELEN